MADLFLIRTVSLGIVDGFTLCCIHALSHNSLHGSINLFVTVEEIEPGVLHTVSCKKC
jgi:hypothetical protein